MDNNESQPQEADQSAPQTPSVAPTAPKASGDNNKKLKLIGIIAGAVVLVSGASAGAYFGVVLPNKPENVLRKSLENTLKLKQVAGKGSVNFTASEKDAKPVVINYSVQSDTTKNAFALTADAAYSGAKLPLEIRGVDKSVFVKVGDLASIKGAVELAQPGAGALIDQVGSKLSNQWIEIDESLLKSASNDDSCSAASLKFSDSDTEKLLDLYDKSKFVTIKSESKDTVEGKSVTKMDLDFSKDKAKTFGEEAMKLDVFKKLEKCSGGSEDKTKTETSKAEDDFKGTANFSLWIDKSKKQIVKIALDVKEDKTGQAKLDFIFTGDKVDIKKPDGAKPATQVLSELGPLFGGLLGGGAATGLPVGTSSAGGAAPSSDLIQKCVAAYEAYSNSQGQSAIPAECASLAQ